MRDYSCQNLGGKFMLIGCQQRAVGSKDKFVSINLLTDEGILLEYTGRMSIERNSLSRLEVRMFFLK